MKNFLHYSVSFSPRWGLPLWGICLIALFIACPFGACNSDNPVTNPPSNPNSVSLLYPSDDTTVMGSDRDTVHFNWGYTGTPSKFIWQIDTCNYVNPTFNNFPTKNFTVLNLLNLNPCDTLIAVNHLGHSFALRRAWRVKAIFGRDTIISPYRFIHGR